MHALWVTKVSFLHLDGACFLGMRINFFHRTRVFVITLRGRGNPSSGEWEILLGEFFLLSGGDLTRSDFDNSNLF